MDLRKLFAVVQGESAKNPFEPPELDSLIDRFCENHLGEKIDEDDSFEQAWEDLMEIIYQVKIAAFSVGYKTAVSLLLAGTL